MPVQSELTIDNRRLPIPENQIESGDRSIYQSWVFTGGIKLTLENPTGAHYPDSVNRLLKGLTRKLEEWANDVA